MSKKGKVTRSGPPFHYLLPFLASVAACMVVYVPMEEPSVAGLVLKCLPIVCLMGFLAVVEKVEGEAAINLLALFFSVLGDACLVWMEELLVYGVAMFGVAQVAYVFAMGFERVSWVSGVGIHVSLLLVVTSLLSGIPSPALKVVVTLYSLLLTTMIWRAFDRARLRRDLPVERRMCSLAGAVVFCMSDVAIVVAQLGRLLPPALALGLILATYYAAQLLLTLGAAENFWAGSVSVKASGSSAKAVRTTGNTDRPTVKAGRASVKTGKSSAKVANSSLRNDKVASRKAK
ncbi:lysoplasmalogenase TMEM86B [Procambarus clarkii]|uniref:lysoplasmalogenase TMEM86B n=1 Tax=Procambarus clarkii TaxID=6728 RepID=UPI001E678755|nr:lysoplasmalogenase-like [Procambarus clarkii]XP_045603576.1 lysoplasmalogenase-like [Procambarus clarkii]